MTNNQINQYMPGDVENDEIANFSLVIEI